MTLDSKIKSQADYWASAEVFDADTRKEIKDLIDKNDDAEITERFYRDLEFGTGGLRGILGAGTSRMNVYNIRKASFALASYIREACGDSGSKIAISYDSRRYSREFAQATAEVMAGCGIKAFITKELRPVPMLSYMVRHFGCNAGVCVTASHNPPEYNGFKVYWETGGQVVPPHDGSIISKYKSITSYEEVQYMPFAEGVAKEMIIEVGDDLDKPYFEKVSELSFNRNGRDDFKIVYSPLHGTGGMPVTRALESFGFKDVVVVPEQSKPDGNFPTVKSPNPEDRSALEMSVQLGQKLNADLVLATDPDADRIGMAVLENGEYKFFNGNQIGSLLVDYVLRAMQESNSLPENPLVIKTIVTTDLQTKIAAHYGAHCDETLTGFKWICQLIEDYETGARTPKRNYVCGGEESYGFLAGSFVRDKDAVIACAIAAEMVAVYKSEGFVLSDVLDQIYRRHGVYLEDLYTLTLPGMAGAEKIKLMMDRLRKDPPKEIAGIKVEKMRDLSNCKEYILGQDGYKEGDTIPLPSSNVLQFLLSDGTKVSTRPSGTEPKIKFYFSVTRPCSKDTGQEKLNALKSECHTQIEALRDAFTAMT